MKKTALIAFSAGILLSLQAQEVKRFNYVVSEYGSYLVTRMNEQAKIEGNRGQVSWTDDNYMSSLISGELKTVFTEEKFAKIHLSSAFIIRFNSRGDIFSCRFIINMEDISIITDDELYQLYSIFRKIKFDMDKVKIDAGTYPSMDVKFDYAEIFGSLVPDEFRPKQ